MDRFDFGEAANSHSYGIVSIIGDGKTSMSELVQNTELKAGIQSFLITNYSFAKLVDGKVMQIDLKTGKISFDGITSGLSLPPDLREKEIMSNKITQGFNSRAMGLLAA